MSSSSSCAAANVRGGFGCIFEFHGPGVATLDVAQRATICSMTVETGATTGVFPSDKRTREWLAWQGRESDWVERAADPGAAYDEDEVIELDRLGPLIATPGSPGNVRARARRSGQAGASRRLDDKTYRRTARAYRLAWPLD
jgi:aconitase A